MIRIRTGESARRRNDSARLRRAGVFGLVKNCRGTGDWGSIRQSYTIFVTNPRVNHPQLALTNRFADVYTWAANSPTLRCDMTSSTPFRDVDDSARKLAKDLLASATYGALAVLRPDTAAPSVSRIALALDQTGSPVTLISTLADHTRALSVNPICALLIGEPGNSGDPLTHPRLTLHASAVFIAKRTEENEKLRAHFLSQRPKAKLYADFTDFGFVRFEISEGLLNGGFGKAWRLAQGDLLPDQRTT